MKFLSPILSFDYRSITQVIGEVLVARDVGTGPAGPAMAGPIFCQSSMYFSHFLNDLAVIALWVVEVWPVQSKIASDVTGWLWST